MKKKEDSFRQFLLELKKYMEPAKHNKVIIFTSKAFVIEKSKPKIFMVINDKI